jgi:hypothetical protein
MTTTIDIPGGTAEMWEMDELTPALTMKLDVYSLRHSAMLAKVQKNAAAIQEAQDKAEAEGTELDQMSIPDIGLDDDEAEQYLTMQYLTALVYLKSWTLDRPVPTALPDLLAVPLTVVRPLVQYAGKANTDAQMAAAGLEESEATVMDPESPTGPSGSSGGPSDSAAPSDTSTPGEPAGSPSTSS